MRKKILIAEHEVAISDSLERRLHLRGYGPVVAADAEAALTAFDANRPDLVVISLTLPMDGGREVCRGIRLRPLGALVPILFLGTGREEVRNVSEAIAAGADHFFRKPEGLGDLLAKVATYIGPGEDGSGEVEPPHGPVADERELLAALARNDGASIATTPEPVASGFFQAIRDVLGSRATPGPSAEVSPRQGTPPPLSAEETSLMGQNTAPPQPTDTDWAALDSLLQGAPALPPPEAPVPSGNPEFMRAAAAAMTGTGALPLILVPTPTPQDTRPPTPSSGPSEGAEPLTEDAPLDRWSVGRRWTDTVDPPQGVDASARTPTGVGTQPTMARATGVGTQPTMARATGVGTQPTMARATGVGTQPTTARATGVGTQPTMARATGVGTQPTTARATGVGSQPTLPGNWGVAPLDEESPPETDLTDSWSQTDVGTRPSSTDFGTRPSSTDFGTRPSSTDFGTRPSSTDFGTRQSSTVVGGVPFSPPRRPAHDPADALAALLDAGHAMELERRGIGELLAAVSEAGLTGRVEVASGGVLRRVFVDAGAPVFADSTEPNEDLVSFLAGEGRLTRAVMAEARERAQLTGASAEEILIEAGYLQPEDVYRALRGYVIERVLSLFSIEAGEATVIRGGPRPLDPVDLGLHPGRLVLDGIRRKYGRLRLYRRFGTPATVPRPRLHTRPDMPGLILRSDEATVLTLVDGRRTALEIARTAQLHEVDTLGILFAFGVLQLLDAPGGIRPAHGLPALDADAMLRAGAPRTDDQMPGFSELLANKYSEIHAADYHQILGVARSATGAEIRSAWERLKRQFDPHRVRRDGPHWQQVREIAAVVDDAFAVLGNERLRARYEVHLQ